MNLKLKINNKGVSLPLVIGLVLVLMMISVSVNELIIRALRNAHQIEASDKAYFSAEAGIEDALYELSEHFAGYETGGVTRVGAKRIDDFDDFGGGLRWENDWEIKSMNDNHDYGTADGLFFYPGQKLIIPLYKDADGTADENKINVTDASISMLNNTSGAFYITFQVPWNTSIGYSSAYSNGLTIDNDGDLGNSLSAGSEGINGLNEDGPGMLGNCDTYSAEDADCDGREDEDSDRSPVILWKITDNAVNSLIPVRGCLTGAGTDDDPEGSEICEKDFSLFAELPNNKLSIVLRNTDNGINQDGVQESIQQFINSIETSGSNPKLQFEFLIVAPLKQAYELFSVLESEYNARTVSIPYLEYNVNVVSSPNSAPLPYFTVNSDGWYKNFKQSISTTVMPKTTAPLFDFTIIQQQ